MAKSHRLHSSLSQSVTNNLFALVHSDIWGPFSIPSSHGFRYYISFIDDFSKFTWIYPIINKSEAFSKFIEFQKSVERQFSCNIKIIRTDNGGEYMNYKFKTYCASTGIDHQSTCPHSPSQNGVAERKHIHLIETTRALLIQASLPLSLWVDVLLTANYLINRIPSSNTNHKSPFEILHGQPPRYDHLKVLGCLCYPWLKPYTSHKLSPTSHPCVFIEYAHSQKGYKCLDIHTHKIYTSRNVIFNENEFPYSKSPTHYWSSNPTPPLILVPNLSILPQQSSSPHLTSQAVITPALANSSTHPSYSTTTTHTPEPTTSTTPYSESIQPTVTPNLHQSKPTHHMLTRLKTGISKPKKIFDLAHIVQTPEPNTYNQAAKFEHWRSAMSQEFQALQAQGTWELVPPQPSMNILGSKWTFRTKYNSDGTIARHKARLVAKGFNQEQGIDYHETFSPVAKMPTIRVLIILALHHNWTIHQLDVSNAFLHGNLSDTVYMSQPPGFQDSMHPGYVCKLKKALYGLKQSPREWYATLSNHLLNYGFKISPSDHSLLTYKSGATRIYMLIYVDDILLAGNSPSEINKLLANLHSTFQMRNLGPLSQFLGIQAIQTKTGLLLHQQQYAHNIIHRAGMDQSKPVTTPLPNRQPSQHDSTTPYDNPQLYRQLIGALQYLTITRPDIQFAVQQLCQHMQNPFITHFDSLKRLLRYIHGSSGTGIPLNRTI
ncbi:Retrovirus-related Pol polyprotein from transposon TNT 1-94 [Dendrobium catenatum]|uniref:Retrovirus-related Pol polyprotein from transposon TNT 1-94 n=1 Tax=Dendrobium catenatum TaxID=906689 RepID=A0A2I0VJG6_9ASPA|nr:Retrovirus-related Pol polyprotein from transposon TNT 1-94 [Dendrobium catenatum]